MTKHSQRLTVLSLIAGLGIAPTLAFAIQPPEESAAIRAAGIFSREFSAPELEVQPSVVTYEQGNRAAAGLGALQGFFARQSADWEIRWDQRSNLPNLVQGVGVPVLPGRGNKLTGSDLGGIGGGGETRLADVETQLRRFMAQYPEMFGIALTDYKLNPASSANVGEDKQVWMVEFQQDLRGSRWTARTPSSASTMATSSSSAPRRWPPVKLASARPLLRQRGGAGGGPSRRAGFQLSHRSGEISTRASSRSSPPWSRASNRPSSTGARRAAATATSWSGSCPSAARARTPPSVALVDAMNGKVLRFADANAYMTPRSPAASIRRPTRTPSPCAACPSRRSPTAPPRRRTRPATTPSPPAPRRPSWTASTSR